jgi:nucleoside-diphosphate-sugar epimerase
VLKSYKYLIIGSNGFIGKSLYGQLCDIINNNHICCLDRYENTIAATNYIRCDIRNYRELSEAVANIDFDFVIYLVSDLSPSRSMDKYDKLYKINVGALKNVLEVLRCRKIRHVIYASTCEVYGNKVFNANEESLTSPISIYSLTKLMAENMLIYYFNNYRLPVTIARLSLVYGGSQNNRFFIPQAISKLGGNKSFDMTHGEQTRDFIYVEDVCNAFVKIIESEAFIGDVVNISSNTEISLKELTVLLKNILKSDSILNFGAIKYRDNEIMRYKINNNKIVSRLHWQPRMKIKDGLVATIKEG